MKLDVLTGLLLSYSIKKGDTAVMLISPSNIKSWYLSQALNRLGAIEHRVRYVDLEHIYFLIEQTPTMILSENNALTLLNEDRMPNRDCIHWLWLDQIESEIIEFHRSYAKTGRNRLTTDHTDRAVAAFDYHAPNTTPTEYTDQQWQTICANEIANSLAQPESDPLLTLG